MAVAEFFMFTAIFVAIGAVIGICLITLKESVYLPFDRFTDFLDDYDESRMKCIIVLISAIVVGAISAVLRYFVL